MNGPKFIFATDGCHTAAILDGVLFGKGIQRLDFSTEGENGDMKSTLRIMDLNIDRAELSTDTREFMNWINGGKK